jgi:hypothetical protein
MKSQVFRSFGLMAVFAGCGAGSGSGEKLEVLAGDEVLDPAAKMTDFEIQSLFGDDVCETLGEQPVPDAPGGFRNGLRARVHVPPADFRTQVGVWSNLSRYFQPDVQPLSNDLFLDQVAVPTRAFSTGFPTLSGQKVQDSEGNDLVEYFALDIRSELNLSAWAESKHMEWAILSDDGASLAIDGQVIAESNAVHPTRLICGTTPTLLSPMLSSDLSLRYFQGPRHHISLTLLWREAGSAAEPLCGRQGNAFWFNAASQPTSNYESLMNRGWSVVPSDHFRVPEDQSFNPCRSSRVREVLAAVSD